MSAATWEHPVAIRRPRPAPVGTLHLTARGRRVITALALVLALAVGLVGGRAMASGPVAGPAEGIAVDVYTVGSGETLWSIAASLVEPGADVRDAVDGLVRLNELPSTALAAGQQLLVPVASD